MEHDITQHVVKVIHIPANSGVSVKLTRSVQGTSLEVDVNRLLKDGETYDECARDAARLVALGYAEGKAHAEKLGLVIGKDQTVTVRGP